MEVVVYHFQKCEFLLDDDKPLVEEWWLLNQPIKMVAKDFQGIYIDLCAVPQYFPPDPRNMLCIREDGGEADDATMSVQELRPMMFRPMKSMGNFYGG